MTVPFGRDYEDADHWQDQDGAHSPADEPVSVVPFPVLAPEALHGLPGKLIAAVAPHTEAHPAAVLMQFLARFGATIGDGAHLRIDNRAHPARIYPLVVGKTSDGAKGTSYGVVNAVFAAAEQPRRESGARRGPLALVTMNDPLRQVSGLSSGEGLIELVRDPNGEDPNAKGFDEGVTDKRLLVVEEEFAGVLSVMERQGNTLPRVLREAWDGLPLRTLTRSPLSATGAHIVVVGHCTPGELRLRLGEAQMLGGTMNRMLPTASRRTRLLPDGGNIPQDVLDEYGPALAEAIGAATRNAEVERDDDALDLWRARYPHLRRSRPDGPVATILARSAPQVLRLALAYALADNARQIRGPHMAAALALWDYVEQTAEWMFGAHVDNRELDSLVGFIAEAGKAGRTRTDVTSGFYKRNKKAAEVGAILGELIKEGQIRQEIDKSGRGRPTARYYAITSTN